jgi:hypothetical protein
MEILMKKKEKEERALFLRRLVVLIFKDFHGYLLEVLTSYFAVVLTSLTRRISLVYCTNEVTRSGHFCSSHPGENVTSSSMIPFCTTI